MTHGSLEPTVRTAASARTPGYDVARAIAIFGMVHVNFESTMDGGEPGAGPSWLMWITERFEGRSAALFVVLAGVGIALRTRRARETGELGPERWALLKRGFILFAVGMVHFHMWEWDILHLYGFFLALAALLVGARAWVLGLVVAMVMAIGACLQLFFDYDMQIELWTGPGFLLDTIFTGDHPMFPWLAFLVVGMGIGRLDLRKPELRRPVLAAAVAVASVGELLDTIVRRAPDLVHHDPDAMRMMFGWPRPPSPAFVLAAGGTAVAVICAVIAITEPRTTARWVIALTATGQLAFTLYLAHTVTIVVLDSHQLLAGSTTVAAIACSTTFNALAVAFSLWWRRRWPNGPLEALIRQVTNRVDPAPWGGTTLR